MINTDKTTPQFNSAESNSVEQKPVEKETSTERVAAETSTTHVKNLNRKSLFNHINTDLKSALDTWGVLTETVTEKTSPDQKQLNEVKKLLQDLQKKLSEFSE